MNLPQIGKLSERQQLVLIILISAALAIGAWSLTTKILGGNEREIRALRAEIEKSGYGNRSIEDLKTELAHEQALLTKTREKWREARKRLGSYANQKALRKANVMHIDYKVELIKQRDRLREKSKAVGVELLPDDLGMTLELADNDETRLRMLQLKAVERLADLTIDRRIKRLLAIAPLPPSVIKEGKKPLLEMFPVSVEFEVDFNNLFGLMQAVLMNDSIFAFDNIQLLAGPKRDAPLRVMAVMKALIF